QIHERCPRPRRRTTEGAHSSTSVNVSNVSSAAAPVRHPPRFSPGLRPIPLLHIITETRGRKWPLSVSLIADVPSEPSSPHPFPVSTEPGRAQDVGSGPDDVRRSTASPLNFGLRL